jgi:hypothetical protein
MWWIAAIWFVGWMVTWPASLAYWQGKYPTLADPSYREDLATSMLFALFPPAWIMMPFLTGFYEHGFQFGRRKIV